MACSDGKVAPNVTSHCSSAADDAIAPVEDRGLTRRGRPDRIVGLNGPAPAGPRRNGRLGDSPAVPDLDFGAEGSLAGGRAGHESHVVDFESMGFEIGPAAEADDVLARLDLPYVARFAQRHPESLALTHGV